MASRNLSSSSRALLRVADLWQKGLPGRVTRQPPPQLPSWHPVPASVPVPPPFRTTGLVTPRLHTRGNPQGGRPGHAVPGKQTKDQSRQVHTAPPGRHPSLQRFRGQGLGQDSGTRPCAPRRGRNPAATSDDGEGGKGRRALAQACVLVHTRPCTRMDTHAGTLTDAQERGKKGKPPGALRTWEPRPGRWQMHPVLAEPVILTADTQGLSEMGRKLLPKTPPVNTDMGRPCPPWGGR